MTFDTLMKDRNIEPCRIPVALLKWINDPVEDLALGSKIYREMAQYTMVAKLSSSPMSASFSFAGLRLAL